MDLTQIDDPIQKCVIVGISLITRLVNQQALSQRTIVKRGTAPTGGLLVITRHMEYASKLSQEATKESKDNVIMALWGILEVRSALFRGLLTFISTTGVLSTGGPRRPTVLLRVIPENHHQPSYSAVRGTA
jgi:hypothetical protein